MKKYIHQLISDIKAAHRHEDEKITNPIEAKFYESYEDLNDELNSDGFSYKPDKYLLDSMTNGPSLSEHCGLTKEMFPPAEKLSDDDMMMIVEEFEDMISTWNIGHSVPILASPTFKYNLTVALLDYKFTPVNGGILFRDYCSGDIESCQLGDYCNCCYDQDEYFDGLMNTIKENAAALGNIKFHFLESYFDLGLDDRPLISIFEKLGVQEDDFPTIIEISESKAIAFIELIKSIFVENELDMHIDKYLYYQQYSILILTLSEPVWMDEHGGFVRVEDPEDDDITDIEDWDDYEDDLFRDELGFNKHNRDIDEDDDLPF